VAVRRCPGYGSEDLQPALENCLELLGGLTDVIPPGSRVLVKINHLSPPTPAEAAVVTHPFFLREVLLLLKSNRCEITVGDDIHSRKGDGFAVSGHRQVCEELGVRLINLRETGFRETSCRGEVLEKTYLSRPALETDCIVNLPKLKTHSFTAFTGAVKNLFGFLPHGLRCRYHREYFRSETFCRMLVDVYACLPPRLNIMDAVVAMEGEGPSAGSPREVGLVIAGTDAVAVDAVAALVTGLDPLSVATTRNANERGLGIGEPSRIEILGENIESVKIPDFRQSTIASGLIRRRLPAFLHAFIQDQLVLTPEISVRLCTGCGECAAICPTGAARLESGTARIDPRRCIHCMCCHEVCLPRAVRLKQKTMGRMFRLLDSAYRRFLSRSP